jgi:3-phosphoshikimate 1-carboxyvinyltransferase
MRSYTALPAAQVSGSVLVPGDKSISHRSVMLGGICDGESRVEGFLPSEDCLASMRAMRALGVEILQSSATSVRVKGVGLHGLKAARDSLDMGNAGTAMRLFTGLLAGQAFDSCLIGDASLSRRPMERVAKPLRQMGAIIETSNGTPPVQIRRADGLHGIEYAMPVASAQVKSALLLAGLYAQGPTTVIEPAPSRDHSERMLTALGARIQQSGLRVRIEPSDRLQGCDIRVPGDFSSAAFFLIAGLIGAGAGGLLIRDVGLNPTRTGLLDILRSMGARIAVQDAREAGSEPVADLLVSRSELNGIKVPPELVPLAIDEFPALFIAAACSRGETWITGAGELRVKESDRIAVMSEGLRALGVEHEVFPDGMCIAGKPEGAAFTGGEVDSRGDHRIAMSFAVASLRAGDEIQIRDVANVATSFPGFAALANGAGLQLSES